MSADFSLVEVIGWPLLNFLWQGTLIGCGAALICAMLRNASPQRRYLVLCCALVACVAWPIYGVYQEVLAPRTLALDTALAYMQQSAGHFDLVFVDGHQFLSGMQPYLPIIVFIWLAGVCLMSARIVVGLLWVRQLGEKLTSLEQRQQMAYWQSRTDALARLFGIQRQVQFRLDARLPTPVTTGSWRPVVVMPLSLMSGMAPPLIDALLAHELAHIKRWDYAVNVIQQCAVSILFYHPAVWWISFSIDAEREQIADDLAANVLGQPRELALALQQLDSLQIAVPTMVPAANGGQLLARIRRLMRDDRQAWHWSMATPLLGVLLMGVVASAIARHDQIADASQRQSLAGIAASESASTQSPVPLLVNLHSAHAVVIDDASGKILLQKEADAITPMASLSKLMTAIVILDAGLNMQEILSVTDEDVKALKGASSRLPIGTHLSRHQMMEMMLIPSDNRAAQVLARTYPGGESAFLRAVQQKIAFLGLSSMHMEEPTGYSKQNVASAADLAHLTQVAMAYPALVNIASAASTFSIQVHAQAAGLHQRGLVARQNTNVLVGQKDWDIQLSKTGFTQDAGRCILMHLHIAGRAITMVLLGAESLQSRTDDIVHIRQAIEQHT